jgi:hypothetical protein
MPKRDPKVGMISKEELRSYNPPKQEGCPHTAIKPLPAKLEKRANELFARVFAAKQQYGVQYVDMMLGKDAEFAANNCFCQFVAEGCEYPYCIICLAYTPSKNKKAARYCENGPTCNLVDCPACHGEHCNTCLKPRCRNCGIADDHSLIPCEWFSENGKDCSLCHNHVYSEFGAKSYKRDIHSLVECKAGANCDKKCIKLHGVITYKNPIKPVSKILARGETESLVVQPPITQVPQLQNGAAGTLPATQPEKPEEQPVNLFASKSVSFPPAPIMALAPTHTPGFMPAMQNWQAMAQESFDVNSGRVIHTFDAAMVGGQKIIINNGHSSITITIDSKNCVITVVK